MHPPHLLKCSIRPWGSTECDPSMFRGLHWCTAIRTPTAVLKRRCVSEWSVEPFFKYFLPAPALLSPPGDFDLGERGCDAAPRHVCFQKLRRGCENYYLSESSAALCGAAPVLSSGAKSQRCLGRLSSNGQWSHAVYFSAQHWSHDFIWCIHLVVY